MDQVWKEKHEGSISHEVCHTIWGKADMETSWKHKNRLSLERQEQDPAQEKMESNHVHVLLPGSQTG